MSPEQQQQLLQRVETLERQMREFTSTPELAPDIKRTISLLLTGSSSKTAASGTQAVNESGASSYSVMKPPTGFISVGGYDIPYIT
jgi:hypothetical protein